MFYKRSIKKVTRWAISASWRTQVLPEGSPWESPVGVYPDVDRGYKETESK